MESKLTSLLFQKLRSEQKECWSGKQNNKQRNVEQERLDHRNSHRSHYGDDFYASQFGNVFDRDLHPWDCFYLLTYVWLYVKKTKLPNGSEFLPLFFT